MDALAKVVNSSELKDRPPEKGILVPPTATLEPNFCVLLSTAKEWAEPAAALEAAAPAPMEVEAAPVQPLSGPTAQRLAAAGAAAATGTVAGTWRTVALVPPPPEAPAGEEGRIRFGLDGAGAAAQGGGSRKRQLVEEDDYDG